jgi:methionyl-tRNA synthetase
MPSLVSVNGLDEDADRSYPVITGDYAATPRWCSAPVAVGTAINKPAPVFAKLDESVIDAELGLA